MASGITYVLLVVSRGRDALEGLSRRLAGHTVAAAIEVGADAGGTALSCASDSAGLCEVVLGRGQRYCQAQRGDLGAADVPARVSDALRTHARILFLRTLEWRSLWFRDGALLAVAAKEDLSPVAVKAL